MKYILKFNDNILFDYNENIKSKLIEQLINNNEQNIDTTLGGTVFYIDFNSKYMKILYRLYNIYSKNIKFYVKDKYEIVDYIETINLGTFLQIDTDIMDYIVNTYKSLCISVIPVQYRYTYNVKLYKKAENNDNDENIIVYEYNTNSRHNIIKYIKSDRIYSMFKKILSRNNINILTRYIKQIFDSGKIAYTESELGYICYYKSVDIYKNMHKFCDDNTLYSIDNLFINADIAKESVTTINKLSIEIDIVNMINLYNIVINNKYANDEYILSALRYYNIYIRVSEYTLNFFSNYIGIDDLLNTININIYSRIEDAGAYDLLSYKFNFLITKI